MVTNSGNREPDISDMVDWWIGGCCPGSNKTFTLIKENLDCRSLMRQCSSGKSPHHSWMSRNSSEVWIHRFFQGQEMARVTLQFLFKITIPFPANPTLPGDSGFHVQGPAAMAQLARCSIITPLRVLVLGATRGR